jgi:hypothetical protein
MSNMRVKDAILAVLTRRELKRLVAQVGITDIDDSDALLMTQRLGRHPGATVALAVGCLREAKVGDVFRYLGMEQPKDYDDAVDTLIARSRDDRDDSADLLPVADRVLDSGGMHGTNNTPTADIVLGALVEWSQKYGVVQSMQEGNATVRFDDGDTITFKCKAGAVQRVLFAAGSQVMRRTDNALGVVTAQLPGRDNPTWAVVFSTTTANVAEMGLRPAVISDPMDRMRSHHLGSAADFNLRSVAADYWTGHLHNNLVSLTHARVDLKPHQVYVVHRVISKYPHRFLLCDEVGLGKTIEAAMVIKELRARSQAKRVLILVPAGLLRQWQYELKVKFNESFAIYNATTIEFLKSQGVVNPWTEHDSVIVSHSWASATPERIREIAEVDWDMVIVDEAHHARVHRSGHSETRTQLFRLVDELVARPEFTRRACFFLTATPLQLDRYELYSLVEMLDPILFSSGDDFTRHFDSLLGLNRLAERLQITPPVDDAEWAAVIPDLARYLGVDHSKAMALATETGIAGIVQLLKDRHRLSEVMIRNRKSVVQGFQPRRAFRWEVIPSPEEKRIHELMGGILRRGFQLAEETHQNAVGY